MGYSPLTNIFENTPFCLCLIVYEFDLSIKDLEILEEFNYRLFFIYAYRNLFAPQLTDLFAEVGGKSPLQLSSGTHFAETEDKIVIANN